MKKISILLFVFTIALAGCKKEEIENKLLGYWVYEEAAYEDADTCYRVSYSGFTNDGYYFKEEGVCYPIIYGRSYDDPKSCLFTVLDGENSQDRGEWSIKSNKINIDWGDRYLVSGEFSLNLDSYSEGIIYINDVKFVKRDYVNE